VQRGHEVTLFNRGQTNPGLFEGVEEIHGDRERDLDRLAGRTWDAVIDTAGYIPRVVRASARALAGAAPHYTFISSISAYAALPEPGMGEDSPLAELPAPGSEDVQKHYGPLKVLCEREVESAWRVRSSSGLGSSSGRSTPTDRFTYWPVRVAAAKCSRPATRTAGAVIDARDLAEWTVRLVEEGVIGALNATGPAARLTMAEVLDACRAASGSGASFTWVEEGFLLERGAGPWQELPFWLPETNKDTRGMLSVDMSRAVAAGLAFRPVEETARATLEWARTRPADHAWRAGMEREKERGILAAWGSRAPLG
jgi:2'-hydroxyisoflavone reductase